MDSTGDLHNFHSPDGSAIPDNNILHEEEVFRTFLQNKVQIGICFYRVLPDSDFKTDYLYYSGAGNKSEVLPESLDLFANAFLHL